MKQTAEGYRKVRAARSQTGDYVLKQVEAHPSPARGLSPHLTCLCAVPSPQIRGTLRFLLGNLDDYSPAAHAVPYPQLPAIDRYLLYKLASLTNEAAAAFDTYQVRRPLYGSANIYPKKMFATL